MRHEHLVVTVEAGIKERIDDDLDGGESLESWVADAIEQKLADETGRSDPRRAGGEPPTSGDDATRRERDSGFATSDDARNRRTKDGEDDRRGDSFDRDRDDGFGDGGDDYDEGFEYVDDCSI